MMSKTKRTWFYVLFALCYMFSALEISAQDFFVPQPQIQAEPLIISVQEEVVDLTKEKRQIADAITKIYKYVPEAEAVKVVDYVYQYSEAYNVQPSLLIGIIAAESSFKRRAVSKEGAAGYTQVLAKHHKKKIKGRNIFHTGVNIEVGTMIFADCIARTKTPDQALGCYNGTTNPKKIQKFKLAVNKRKNEIIQLAML